MRTEGRVAGGTTTSKQSGSRERTFDRGARTSSQKHTQRTSKLSFKLSRIVFVRSSPKARSSAFFSMSRKSGKDCSIDSRVILSMTFSLALLMI